MSAFFAGAVVSVFFLVAVAGLVVSDGFPATFGGGTAGTATGAAGCRESEAARGPALGSGSAAVSDPD